MNNGQLRDGEIQVFDVYGRMLQVVGISDACISDACISDACISDARISDARISDARGASLLTAEIDLSRYATGIYLVKLVNGGKVVAVRKVVKQ